MYTPFTRLRFHASTCPPPTGNIGRKVEPGADLTNAAQIETVISLMDRYGPGVRR